MKHVRQHVDAGGDASLVMRYRNPRVLPVSIALCKVRARDHYERLAKGYYKEMMIGGGLGDHENDDDDVTAAELSDVDDNDTGADEGEDGDDDDKQVVRLPSAHLYRQDTL